MKIVCLSDSHDRHAELRLPPGDVLIHAGDCWMQGHVAETQVFLDWFAAQPHRRLCCLNWFGGGLRAGVA
jgi:hypothetical protein